jgi:hypothetical protein
MWSRLVATSPLPTSSTSMLRPSSLMKCSGYSVGQSNPSILGQNMSHLRSMATSSSMSSLSSITLSTSSSSSLSSCSLFLPSLLPYWTRMSVRARCSPSTISNRYLSNTTPSPTTQTSSSSQHQHQQQKPATKQPTSSRRHTSTSTNSSNNNNPATPRATDTSSSSSSSSSTPPHPSRSTRIAARRRQAMLSSDTSMQTVIRAFGGNIIIALLKYAAWSATRSSAMLAEAIHTTVDVGNQALLLFGSISARQAPDALHPYGYGRNAYFYSLVSAMGMFWLGAGVTAAHGLYMIYNPHDILTTWHNWAVLGFSFSIDGW